jgi:hypothetical protein
VTPTVGDVVLAARSECDQFYTSIPSELDEDGDDAFCADDGGDLGAETYTVDLAVGEEIFLVVQAYDVAGQGLFTGTVDAP